MTKEVKTWTGLDGIPWTKSKVTRRTGSGEKTKVIDIFENGRNVHHIETSTLNDQKEIEQFNRVWARNWYRALGF